MPSALARNSIVTNQSHENSGGQQLRSQQSITREMPHPHRPVGSSLNWGPNNLEDVTLLAPARSEGNHGFVEVKHLRANSRE